MSQMASERTLTEEVADFLARGPSAEETLGYQIPDDARERIAVLMETNEAGTLTPDETTALDEITILDQLFTLSRAHHVSQLSLHEKGDRDA